MARETIEEFITNRDFWKSDTAEDLRSLYQFMVDLGAKHDDAIDMIECTIGAIANEYGD